MAKIERNQKESFDAFLRRVKRQWRNNGNILEARNRKHFKKKPSKNVQNKQTVRSVQKQSKLSYLKKTGKIPEDQFQI